MFLEVDRIVYEPDTPMVTSYRATGKQGNQGAGTIPMINTNGRGAPEANNAAIVGDNFHPAAPRRE